MIGFSRKTNWFKQALGVAVFSLLSLNSQAGLVTLAGSNFDVTFDDQLLQPASAAASNNLKFATTDFAAGSINGQAARLGTSVSRNFVFTFTVHSGFQLQSLDLLIQGDAFILGSAAGNVSALVNNNTPLVLDSQPNANDNNWTGRLSLPNPAQSFTLQLATTLSAESEPVGQQQGANVAFVESKFLGISVNTQAINEVPEPGLISLLLTGLWLMRRQLRS